MKQENIEALCKAIAPTTPTDPRERGRVASLLLDFGKKEGPSISAAELARLVDARLRQRKDRDGLKPEKIVEEIEATLDLVGMCEFMLEARRRQARQTQSEMFQVAFEKTPTASEMQIADPVEREKKVTERMKRERQIRDKIEGETFPLDFATGLIRMGVPGSPAKREEIYWEYFKQHCAGTESEIRESFEKWKKIGWRNVHDLLPTAEQFGRWRDASVRLNKRAAGKASAKARKPHSKRTK